MVKDTLYMKAKELRLAWLRMVREFIKSIRLW